MKGEPFHFNQEQTLAQWGPLDIITPFSRLPICNGNNGPAYVNCKRPKCDGTNGPMDGVASSGCVQEVVNEIPSYDDDPKAGRPYKTTGDLTKTDVTPAPATRSAPDTDNGGYTAQSSKY